MNKLRVVIDPSAPTISQQKEAFTALLQSLGQASFAEIKSVLDEREAVAPERELTPDVVERLQQRIAGSLS